MATTFSPTRSRSTNTSPQRPLSSYSTSSTIRKVTPSPDSLSEALKQNLIFRSTPRRRNSSASFSNVPRPFNSTPVAARHGNSAAINKDSNPPSPSPLIRRQGHASPSKDLPRPISIPAPASTSAQMLSTTWERARPETPTPLSDKQRREQYTPLGFSEPYLTPNAKETPVSLANSPSQHPSDYGSRVGEEDPDRIEVISNPNAHVGLANMALFSTPNRDVNGGSDGVKMYGNAENPFAGVKNVDELEAERRKVSLGTKRDGNGNGKGAGKEGRGCCGLGCCVM